jgi:hypothetical protein
MREEIQALRDWAKTRARPASLPDKGIIKSRERKIEL